MSADELRKAAETLRQTAGALRDHSAKHGSITGGPDSWWSASFLANAIAAHAPGTTDDNDFDILDEHYVLAGEWLALVKTGVGLALADWLDAEAAIYERLEEISMTITPKGYKVSWGESTQAEAEALARLINGGESR